jgi:hypothetical protein
MMRNSAHRLGIFPIQSFYIRREITRRGIHDSLADRAVLLLKRVEKHQRIGGAAQSEISKSENASGEMMFIGGVATQRGMVKALE